MWFSQCCPKHSFVMWLAVHGRLATQDRISKWKPNEKYLCPLCGKCADSHDHLFFSCEFSSKVWCYLCKKIECTLPFIWATIVHVIVGLGFKNNINNITRRLLIGASVYMIWKERNARIFMNKKQTEDEVIRQIEDNIKSSLMCLTIKESNAIKNVENIWNVKMIRKMWTDTKCKVSLSSVLCNLKLKASPNDIRKVACFGGMPTSDALTAGLIFHP
ncbi:reverse transcriptase zinc-binding domain-containing protein [Tanacetum coccineum]